MGIKASPHLGMRRGSSLLGEAFSSGNCKVNLGTEVIGRSQATVSGSVVLDSQGCQSLALERVPRTRGGHVFEKSSSI